MDWIIYGGNLREKGGKDVYTEIKGDVHGGDYNILIEKDSKPLFTINMLTEEIIRHDKN